jgi:hypothetical protein
VPLSLQLLFSGPTGLVAGSLTHMLRELHPSLAEVRVEVITGAIVPGKDEVGQMARVKWRHHTVQVVLFNTPFSSEITEQVVDSAHYEDELRAQARAHTSHAVLLYRGEEKDPLEQYIALGMIAVGLAPLGALVVANASAYTSCPASPLIPRSGEDLNQILRDVPLTALFVGFVEMQVNGTEGIWMRTCGAPLLGLPDLAWCARSQDEGLDVLHRFNGMLHTMRDAGVVLSEGDLVEDGALNWTLRKPRANEGFLGSPRMLVLEAVTS